MKIIRVVSTLIVLLFFLTSVASAGYGDFHHKKHSDNRKYISCNETGCYSCKNHKCTPIKNHKCKYCKSKKPKPCVNCSDNNSSSTNNNSSVPIPPVSGNETGTTIVKLCKGNTCVYGNGGVMTITNYASARNVDYNTLIAFAKANKIDERSYNANSYNCMFYARDFHNACEAAGIKAGWCASDNADHAWNIFSTTDKGTIYIDCTGVPGGKADQDKELFIGSGGKLTGRYLTSDYVWSYGRSAPDLEVYW